MAPNRIQKRPGRRAQPTAAGAPRPSRNLKRRMILRLIALENEQGEPREVPRDVDIQGRYTLANMARYMGPGLQVALARTEEAHRGAGFATSDSGEGVVERGRGPTTEEWNAVLDRVRAQGRIAMSERCGAPDQILLPTQTRVRTRCRDGPPPDPTNFLDLPPEIREFIYRHLLVSPRPVTVHNTWSTLYRRQRDRPALHAAIIRASKLVFAEARRVLYAENYFEYLIRDAMPTRPEDEMPEQVAEEDSDGEYSGEDGGETADGQLQDDTDINIRRYGPTMRLLGLRAEANRSGADYLRTATRAITAFSTLSPMRANVHTLRVNIQTMWRCDTDDFGFAGWFAPGTALMNALVRLPCRFIEFAIGTPAGRETVVRVDRRYGTRIRRAKRGLEEYALKDEVLRRVREEGAAREFAALMGIGERIAEEGAKDRVDEEEYEEDEEVEENEDADEVME